MADSFHRFRSSRAGYLPPCRVSAIPQYRIALLRGTATPRTNIALQKASSRRARFLLLRQVVSRPPPREKGPLICQASLTHAQASHANPVPPPGVSQQEHTLAFDAHNHLDHEDHDHEAPINGSAVHKILAWVFSTVGLLQIASQLRGRTWNAITIACLMSLALLTAWLGGAQVTQAILFQQISTVSTASIYVLAGIPELVDLCFDLTAGHIDTHVLMTLAVFGTLAIGGALEVT